jgi:hypothetical protein
MIYESKSGTESTPPEYRNSDPVRCTVCGAEHDETEELSTWIYHSESDNVVCRTCVIDENVRLFRIGVLKAARIFARELEGITAYHRADFDDAEMDNLSDLIEEWLGRNAS